MEEECRRACEADLETAATPWLEQGLEALAVALGACNNGGAERAALLNDCENIAVVSMKRETHSGIRCAGERCR